MITVHVIVGRSINRDAEASIDVVKVAYWWRSSFVTQQRGLSKKGAVTLPYTSPGLRGRLRPRQACPSSKRTGVADKVGGRRSGRPGLGWYFRCQGIHNALRPGQVSWR